MLFMKMMTLKEEVEMSFLQKQTMSIAIELKQIAKQIDNMIDLLEAHENKKFSKKNKQRSIILHNKPDAGSIFKKKYKGKIYTMTVVHEGNNIGYKVGRKIYRSPSSAAKSITNYEINGWVFWSI